MVVQASGGDSANSMKSENTQRYSPWAGFVVHHKNVRCSQGGCLRACVRLSSPFKLPTAYRPLPSSSESRVQEREVRLEPTARGRSLTGRPLRHPLGTSLSPPVPVCPPSMLQPSQETKADLGLAGGRPHPAHNVQPGHLSRTGECTPAASKKKSQKRKNKLVKV